VFSFAGTETTAGDRPSDPACAARRAGCTVPQDCDAARVNWVRFALSRIDLTFRDISRHCGAFWCILVHFSAFGFVLHVSLDPRDLTAPRLGRSAAEERGFFDRRELGSFCTLADFVAPRCTRLHWDAPCCTHFELSKSIAACGLAARHDRTAKPQAERRVKNSAPSPTPQSCAIRTTIAHDKIANP